MTPAERVKLARLAYIRAVALARATPSPASWVRLLTAARNLNEAVRDRDRQAQPAQSDRPFGA